MPKNKLQKLIINIFTFVAFIAITLGIYLTDTSDRPALEINKPIENMTVTEVVDGDTIKVYINGENKTIRLIGIDTPETVHPQKDVQCFGLEAKEYLTKEVLNRVIRLEKDTSEVDRYGRMLRFVFVDDEMINEKLVKNGYAYAVEYYPDTSHSEKFEELEEFARTNELGLWNPASCAGKREL